MLTLTIETPEAAERIAKALEGYEPYDSGELTIYQRDDDGTFEICMGEEGPNDVVAVLEE